MSEIDVTRSIRAGTIRGSIIVTGDGNHLGAALEPPEDAVAPPSDSPGPLARAVETAKQAEAFSAHAGAIVARAATACRAIWVALLAVLGRPVA